MKSRFLILLIIGLLLTQPLVSAATLVSGSTLEIQDNQDNFDGEVLVGEVAITPTVDDSISFTKEDLPEGKDVRNAESIDINFDRARYVQNFEVQEQEPLVIPEVVRYTESTYFASQEYCVDQFENYVTEDLGYTDENGNPNYVFGAEMYVYAGVSGCTVRTLVNAEHGGWVGSVTKSGFDYSQDISFSDGESLSLDTTTDIPEVVDVNSGHSEVRLLDFGNYLTSEMTDNEIYAYHSNPESPVSKDWQVFHSRNTPGTTFSETRNEIVTNWNDVLAGTQKTTDDDVDPLIEELRTLASDIEDEAVSTTPEDWKTKGNMNELSRDTNSISVPYNSDSITNTARLQLILDGGEFIVDVSTGIPQIDSAPDTLTLTERDIDSVPYTISNVGSASSGFAVGLESCNGIQSQNKVIDVDAGETVEGELRVQSQSSDGQDFSEQCRFVVEDTRSQERSEKTVEFDVVAKDRCVEGEERPPVEGSDGEFMVVEVLDSSCSVKETKTCPNDASHRFELNDNNKWTCVDVESGEGVNVCDDGSVPPCEDSGDEGDFSSTLFFITLALSVLSGLFAYFNLSGLKALGRYGGFVQIVLALLVAGAVFLGVPLLAQAGIDYFTLDFSVIGFV